MKSLYLLIGLMYACFNVEAAAPLGIKGQKSTATLYSNVHQFPNNQVTDIGGNHALAETDNKNILTNPSFEHKTTNTGWTLASGTFSSSTTDRIDGNKSAAITLTSQTLNLTQTTTLYASSYNAKVYGQARIWVKGNEGYATEYKLCAIIDGVVSSTYCTILAGNYDDWNLLEVKFPLGATSNGISLVSGSITGTVWVDGAYLGPSINVSTVETPNEAPYVYAGYKIFSAWISSTGFPHIDSGNWITGNCTVSTNNYTCTITGFAQYPACTISILATTTPAFIAQFNAATTQTSMTYSTFTAAGVAAAKDVYIICHGLSF